MPGIQLDPTTNTNYYRHYTTDDGFAADIYMNPRDAMVFAQITKLPESQPAMIAALNEFIEILAKAYGAKSTLNISPALLQKIPTGILKSTKGVGRYISADEAKNAVDVVRNKKHVADQLAKFTSGEYTFLTKEQLKTRITELSDFKIRYSSFASKEKIENGQYSEKAEEDKLNNPFVEHFAIEHQGKIIACEMDVVYGNKTYSADFVVHPDYRSKNIHPQNLADNNYPHGLSQALCVKIYDHMLNHHNYITGSWFIAGGYGGQGVGAHLYDEVFPTKTIQNNEALQNAAGIFLMFGNPGPALLLAANRNLMSTYVNDDEKPYVETALAILQQSTEPDLAAKQPSNETKPKEQVVPISTFTRTDKTPASTTQINDMKSQQQHKH